MLAVTTTDALSVLDAPTLKKSPSSFPSCLSFIYPPTSSAWSHDNASLFVSSAHVIHKYNSSTNSLKDIYATNDDETISQIAVKDSSSLVFVADDKVHILELGSSKVSQTLNTHKSRITSISLSNDSTLLASTSSSAVHVHNIVSESHTVLRGLPTTNDQTISTCYFHPHTRTKLLLGIGKQLVVYDITRPSAPVKVIPLNEASSSGDIQAIGCSPFSKTLVAVATTGGSVGLVDLEKEKGLFRTLNVKVPLSSLSFSPEGASIYLGTENGKVLIVDLRGLDKPPKTIVVSDIGSKVVAMSVQKKSKSTTDSKTPSSSSSAVDRKPSSTSTVSTLKSKGTPARPTRVVSGVSPSTTKSPAPLRKTASEATATKNKPEAGSGLRKVFSPVRSPLRSSQTVNANEDGFSAQIDILPTLSRRNKDKDKDGGTVKGVGKTSPGKVLQAQDKNKRRVGRITTSISSASNAGRASVKSPSASTASVAGRIKERERATSTASSASATRTRTRDRTESVASASSRVTSKSSASSSSSSSSSRTRSTSATSSGSVPPVPPIPEDVKASLAVPLGRARQVSGGTTVGSRTRTPSPELPEIRDPVTPMPGRGIKRSKMRELGLGTPGLGVVDKGKGKEKNVGFDGDEDGADSGSGHEDTGEDTSEDDDEDDDEAHHELLKPKSSSSQDRKKQLRDEMQMQMQISPRRSMPSGLSASVSASGSPIPYSWAKMNGSPARNSGGPNANVNLGLPLTGSPSQNPQGFLRNVIQDILVDYHTQTRQEILGLHLDLVRMGRGWRKEVGEVKGLVEELVENQSQNSHHLSNEDVGRLVREMKELKEENKRLKEENERLRMGIV
ncbi:hypothetical protein VKT23_011027 [Stygiomarasmius scandens]|uniref:WD40 repeat-like protein n=1 Tax=Marasmiellus scandens TaxID=2682957 RepID=A0ABR1J9N0_9AGAR